jgi:hypothetical protein
MQLSYNLPCLNFYTSNLKDKNNILLGLIFQIIDNKPVIGAFFSEIFIKLIAKLPPRAVKGFSWEANTADINYKRYDFQ